MLNGVATAAVVGARQVEIVRRSGAPVRRKCYSAGRLAPKLGRIAVGCKRERCCRASCMLSSGVQWGLDGSISMLVLLKLGLVSESVYRATLEVMPPIPWCVTPRCQLLG